MTLWMTSETWENTACTFSAPARVGSSASRASRLRRRSSLKLWSWLCSTASVVRSTTGCSALACDAAYAPRSRLRNQRMPRLRAPLARPSTQHRAKAQVDDDPIAGVAAIELGGRVGDARGKRLGVGPEL